MKFKIGDRVQIVTTEMQEQYAYMKKYPVKGDTGVIEKIGSSAQPYLVHFDNGKHNGEGKGWWCRESDLGLIQENNGFVVGAHVRVINGTDNLLAQYGKMHEGKTGTILTCFRDTKSYHCVRLDDGTAWNIWENDLELLDTAQGVETNIQPNVAASTTTETKPMLYRVTAIATPSLVAQQAGKAETLLLDNEPVLANDPTSAAFLVGLTADVKVPEGNTVRVIVQQVS